MTGEARRWSWKEGYILAAAPAVGLFCVNRYEAGRFAYLGIPTELIDLPVSRLIGGGTAIVLLGAMLFTSITYARNHILADSGWRRFLGALILCFALFGLPTLMLATTANPVIWALLLTISFAGAVTDTGNTRSSDEKKQPSELIGYFILVGLLSYLLYSFGFFSERMTLDRLCVTDRQGAFVAGHFGDKAILKRVDGDSAQVLPGIELVSSELRIHPCKLPVRGMASILDKAYSGMPTRTDGRVPTH